MRTLFTLYYFCSCGNALRFPDFDITQEKTNEKPLDFGPQHWSSNSYERGAIAVGKPFEFDVDQLDEAAELELTNAVRPDARPNKLCRDGHHFFTEDDCKLFISKEMCDKKRETKTFLASYPGSGNSWMRLLLEDSFGIYTGSVYEDKPLKRDGMLGEGSQDPSEVIVIKTHKTDLNQTDQALAVIRDPLHAALSFQTWMMRRNHNEEVQNKEHLEEVFHRKIEERLKQWAEWARFFKDRPNTLVLRYEDLAANTREMFLKKIYPFMGVNPEDEDLLKRLDCAIYLGNCGSACSTGTKRDHSYTFEFTDYHKDALKRVVEPEILQYYGYTQ